MSGADFLENQQEATTTTIIYPGPHSEREVHEVTTGLSPFPAPRPPPNRNAGHPAPAMDTRPPPPPCPNPATQASRQNQRGGSRSDTEITATAMPHVVLMPVDPLGMAIGSSRS